MCKIFFKICVGFALLPLVGCVSVDVFGVSLGSSCGSGHANAIVYAKCSNGFSSQETIKVPTSNGEAPSVFVSSGGVFATGAAAKNLTKAAQPIVIKTEPKPKTKPANLKQIAVSQGQGETKTLLGGLTALPSVNGSEAYLTARHVLQGLDKLDLQRSFVEAGKDIRDYSFFEFKLKGSPVDLVMIVRKGDENKILKVAPFTIPASCCAEDSKQPFALVDDLNIRRGVELGDFYYSKQFGTVGHETTLQVSSDEISRIGMYAFFLDTGKGNYSTARSSGSIVQVANPQKVDAGEKNAWSVGGVVECYVPERTTADGVKIPAAVRVISGATMVDSVITSVAPEAIFEEVREPHKECVPIDLRGAGGG